MSNEYITESEKNAVYKTIYGRRDVRSFFTQEPIPSETLARILQALLMRMCSTWLNPLAHGHFGARLFLSGVGLGLAASHGLLLRLIRSQQIHSQS